MSPATDLLAIGAYLGAAFGKQRLGAEPARNRHWLCLAAAGLLLHAMSLGLTGAGLPRLGFGSALSLFFWHCAVIHTVLVLRYPLWHLAPTVWALASLGVVAGLVFSAGAPAAAMAGMALRVHVILALTAWALLTLAALQLVAFAVADRRLRDHRAPPLADATPLVSMEQHAFGLMAAGFAILCLSVGSGFLFVDDFMAQHLVHKTVLSLIACAVFALLLLGRSLRGWRGRIALRWALGGYASLILAYFGSKFVLEQLLGRSWS